MTETISFTSRPYTKAVITFVGYFLLDIYFLTSAITNKQQWWFITIFSILAPITGIYLLLLMLWNSKIQNKFEIKLENGTPTTIVTSGREIPVNSINEIYYSWEYNGPSSLYFYANENFAVLHLTKDKDKIFRPKTEVPLLTQLIQLTNAPQTPDENRAGKYTQIKKNSSKENVSKEQAIEWVTDYCSNSNV